MGKNLNTEYYIARRLAVDKEGRKLLSRSIVRLSLFAISLSIAVIIITLAVVTGFKKEITDQVVGFGSHIQIINSNDSLNQIPLHPIPSALDEFQEIRQIKGVRHIQPFVTKPGIIKTGQENQGVIVKGVDSTYDWDFIRKNLVDGRLIRHRDIEGVDEVLISRILASMLKKKVGDNFHIYFFQDRTRVRNCIISGIFETSFENFDRQFIFMDMAEVQGLYDWEQDYISGFEVLISDFNDLDRVAEKVDNTIGAKPIKNRSDLDDSNTVKVRGIYLYNDKTPAKGSHFYIRTIRETYKPIFDWLNLLNMNVIVILSLMIVVAIVNMISGLIILILDRTQTIGLLKAIGANNQTIKRIFLYQALFLIVRGLLIGNVLAIGLSYLQDKYHFFRLDKASYFTDYVPINLDWLILLTANLASLLLIFLSMYLPALIITRVDPVKTLRYE